MNKSYQESNGTSLSTNWKDVSKKNRKWIVCSDFQSSLMVCQVLCRIATWHFLQHHLGQLSRGLVLQSSVHQKMPTSRSGTLLQNIGCRLLQPNAVYILHTVDKAEAEQ